MINRRLFNPVICCITEPHRQNRLSLKWHNDGLCCRPYRWTRTSCLISCRQLLQWAVLLHQSPAVVPEAEVISSSEVSDPAGWTVGVHSFSFCTFLTTRCVGLCICQIKTRGIYGQKSLFPSRCTWPCHPAAVTVMITGQRHQSIHRASWDWTVRMRGSRLPRTPCCCT